MNDEKIDMMEHTENVEEAGLVASPVKRLVIWLIESIAEFLYMSIMSLIIGGALYLFFTYTDGLGRISNINQTYKECVIFCCIVSIASKKRRFDSEC